MMQFNRALDQSIVDGSWILNDKADNEALFELKSYVGFSPIFSNGEILYLNNPSNSSVHIFRIVQIYSLSYVGNYYTQLCKIVYDDSKRFNAFLKITDDENLLWNLVGNFYFQQPLDYFCCKLVLPNNDQKQVCVMRDYVSNFFSIRLMNINDETNSVFRSNIIIYITMDDFFCRPESIILYRKWIRSFSSEILLIKESQKTSPSINDSEGDESSSIDSERDESSSIDSERDESSSIDSEGEAPSTNNSEGDESSINGSKRETPIAEIIQDSPNETQVIVKNAELLVDREEDLSLCINDLIDTMVTKVVSVIEKAKNMISKFYFKYFLNKIKNKKIEKVQVLEEVEFQFPKKHAKKIDSKEIEIIHTAYQNLEAAVAVVEEKVIIHKKGNNKKYNNKSASSPKRKESKKNDDCDDFLILDLLSEFGNQYNELFKKSGICKSHINEIYDRFKSLVESYVSEQKKKPLPKIDILFNIFMTIMGDYPELSVEKEVPIEEDEKFRIIYSKFYAFFGDEYFNTLDKVQQREFLIKFETLSYEDFKKELPENFLSEVFFRNPITKKITFSLFLFRNILIEEAFNKDKQFFNNLVLNKEENRLKLINDCLLRFTSSIIDQFYCVHILNDVFREVCILSINIFEHYYILVNFQIEIFLLEFKLKNKEEFPEKIDKIFALLKTNSLQTLLKVRMLIHNLLETIDVDSNKKYEFVATNIGYYIHFLAYNDTDVRPEFDDPQSDLSLNFEKNVKNKYDELIYYYDTMNELD